MIIDSENTNIGIRHLLAAVTIRDEGSFVRAADRLNVAPSALTETIRQIEEFAGVALFDRTTRPVRPSDDAQMFFEEAAVVLRKFSALMTDLRHIGKLERGCVRIGVAPSIALHFLAPAIARFRAEHPSVDIEVHDDVAGRVADLVRHGELDMGIVARGQSDPEFQEEHLFHDRFGLVCHRDHPLARRAAPPRLAEINPAEVISLKADTGISRMLREHPGVPEALRDGRLQTYSTISQLTLISRNLGVALLPRLAADVIQSAEIVFRDIADLQLDRGFSVLTRRRSTPTIAAARLLSYMKQVISQQQPGLHAS